MIRASVIVLAVFASTAAMAECDTSCLLEQFKRENDEKDARAAQNRHNMIMEMEAHQANELQYESNITQQGVLDQLRHEDIGRHRPY